jgi:hypothetical protein
VGRCFPNHVIRVSASRNHNLKSSDGNRHLVTVDGLKQNGAEFVTAVSLYSTTHMLDTNRRRNTIDSPMVSLTGTTRGVLDRGGNDSVEFYSFDVVYSLDLSLTPNRANLK